MARYRRYRPPTLLQILGGVEFAQPAWLPYHRLMCSRCFRSLWRTRFSRPQREKRVEPVCLECERDEPADPAR